jgi:hypothetical protein
MGDSSDEEEIEVALLISLHFSYIDGEPKKLKGKLLEDRMENTVHNRNDLYCTILFGPI